MGSAMISWFSRKQSNVALSMAEAEYKAACSASCEAIWLRKLMSGLFNLELDTTVILCDNQSCIKMTENPVFYDKSKCCHLIHTLGHRKVNNLLCVSLGASESWGPLSPQSTTPSFRPDPNGAKGGSPYGRLYS